MKHVVLVGLPGSGKTAVGRLAARQLGAPFVDLDEDITARAGKSIERIFAEDGEAAFRAMEAEMGLRALAGPPAVVAPGGGFLEDERNRGAAERTGLVVYLETTAETAASRLEGVAGRPLLSPGDPAARLRDLLERRRARYLEADCVVATEGRTATEVAAAVASLARGRGGW